MYKNLRAVVSFYKNNPEYIKLYFRSLLGKSQSLYNFLKKKASFKETKNPIKLFFKRIILNDFTVPIMVSAINFLDKLFIPLPKICYIKIMDYYRIKGIKESI